MTFAWPYVLWALALPLGWALRRRTPPTRAAAGGHPHIAAAEAGAASVGPARAEPAARRPGAWLAWGVAFAILALARPQWGRGAAPGAQSAREILIALDLSRSMLTSDVPPSRLERAKLLVQSLLDELPGERVGLMVFAGSPFLQAPLSSDYEIMREFLPHLGPDYLPDGGTNYGPLLAAASEAFTTDSGADRYLVLLSDGGANDSDWSSRIGDLRRQGIRVIALGVGTPAGGFIPNGAGGFMKDERGAVVLSKLESASLRQLAHDTGGVYRTADNWVDVASLVRSTIDAGKQGRFDERRRGAPIDRFQWALAPALLCLLLSLYREFPVQPRTRAIKWAAAASVLALFFAAGIRAAEPSPMPPQELLGHIVDRLAGSPQPPSALDWAEMARQTLTWGRAFTDAGTAAPAGPVDDALAAVSAGRSLDAKAADWPALERDLAGLKDFKPPPPKTPPPPSPSPNADQSEETSAPPPPSSAPPAEAAGDPTLAAPLQELDRVRNADSPAQLFQMLDRQNRRQQPPPVPNPKNW